MVLNILFIFADEYLMLFCMLEKSTRDKCLTDTYRSLLHKGDITYKMTLKRMMEKVINSPAPSFFIAPETARNYIYQYEKGKFQRGKLAQILQRDLYETFLKLTKEHPDTCKAALIEMAAAQPAPRYYVSVKTAKYIIFPRPEK